jgi:hypothetical protein
MSSVPSMRTLKPLRMSAWSSASRTRIVTRPAPRASMKPGGGWQRRESRHPVSAQR